MVPHGWRVEDRPRTPVAVSQNDTKWFTNAQWMADHEQARIDAVWEQAEWDMKMLLTLSATVRRWGEANPLMIAEIRMCVDKTLHKPLSLLPRGTPVGAKHRHCACVWRLHGGYNFGMPYRVGYHASDDRLRICPETGRRVRLQRER